MSCLTIKMTGPQCTAEDLILPLMLPTRRVECLKLQVRHSHAVSLPLAHVEETANLSSSTAAVQCIIWAACVWCVSLQHSSIQTNIVGAVLQSLSNFGLAHA